ncbi:MAG: aldehyde ferredoxin oxidoreductase [Gammaproteobacteria bacterium]|nr:aldehyde ferredoxin oxidoreductase [Gammaproteobacteria bacterium]
MRNYLHIDLQKQTVDKQQLHGEDIARSGRYLIAKTLLDSGAADIDPLSPDNPLIFSAGPFAGSNFSNANRTSIGCKSPLTGGIKEANAGGTLGFAMGQLQIAGFTLYQASAEWVVIHIAKGGAISFDAADAYLGKGNFEAAELLHERYGKKVSLALCGPVGEYEGLLAGIAVSDAELRPSRIAARGGVGAVMGNKKVKAIVVELDRMPQFHDRKKVMGAVKEYRAKLLDGEVIQTMKNLGTAFMADVQNRMGGLPVRNFSEGRLVDTDKEPLKMGGDFIREQNLARGGVQSHACMPGCVIECSNVYADAEGNEIVSPVEYETLGLMGTNCGLTDPDDLARMNYIANDLGVDTIETGAMMAVLMESGMAEFGDLEFMKQVFEEIRNGTEQGKFYAQGTARVGEHYGVQRVPVIKKQAISAYDPRVVEVTGITMMVTAQGADHTAGNVPTMDCTGKSLDELVAVSLEAQVTTAASDSLGLCIFGRSITNPNADFIVNAINDAHGTELTVDFFLELGHEALRLEAEFNEAAGFTAQDDELPEFFYTEPLAPSEKVARHHSGEVRERIADW